MMSNIKVGDKVRFLNSTGGGVSFVVSKGRFLFWWKMKTDSKVPALIL